MADQAYPDRIGTQNVTVHCIPSDSPLSTSVANGLIRKDTGNRIEFQVCFGLASDKCVYDLFRDRHGRLLYHRKRGLDSCREVGLAATSSSEWTREKCAVNVPYASSLYALNRAFSTPRQSAFVRA